MIQRRIRRHFRPSRSRSTTTTVECQIRRCPISAPSTSTGPSSRWTSSILLPRRNGSRLSSLITRSCLRSRMPCSKTCCCELSHRDLPDGRDQREGPKSSSNYAAEPVSGRTPCPLAWSCRHSAQQKEVRCSTLIHLDAHWLRGLDTAGPDIKSGPPVGADRIRSPPDAMTTTGCSARRVSVCTKLRSGERFPKKRIRRMVAKEALERTRSGDETEKSVAKYRCIVPIARYRVYSICGSPAM